ncbi:MAG: DUF1749 domain-containing protein [Candidatus Nitronauta litoralis]|uniref:DUF1749 domain-containing protein n=1 Tax=Candidatus Nitronauta litoralis TaxID=2705533 RepID=A0A7T0G1B9_9BACT|nr:MAG: DUF1749 domain-containing protein [Candidatus Nitronauta litoralis]
MSCPRVFKLAFNIVLLVFLVLPSVSFGVESDNTSNETPSNIRAVVSNQEIHLSWDHLDITVDQYRIDIAEVDQDTGTISPKGFYEFTPETIRDLGGDKQEASLAIQFLPDGVTPLQNSKKYSLSVRAVTNGQLSDSSEVVTAVPHVISADPPATPILFLHGFTGSSGGTFGDTTQFLEQQLGWTRGGNLKIVGDNFNLVPENFNANGDFFTMDFGDDTATYPDSQGLIHQAEELEVAIDYLKSQGVSPIMVMGHSNGGQVARYYLANHPQAATNVTKSIAYGSPHRGADLSFFGGPSNHGIRDTFYACSPANEIVYQGKNLFGEDIDNQFLTNLSQQTLPTLDEGYVSILGSKRERSPNCHPTDLGDGVVARTSQDLRLVDNPPENIKTILTDHLHSGQGNHFSAVMCGMDQSRCAVFSMKYQGNDPVTLQVTSPTGERVREAGASSELIEIPGADLMEVSDEGAIEMDTVIVPFADPGVFTVLLTPASGSSPTDIFTLVAEVGGVEVVLAEDMMVQDLPPAGFTVLVPYPLGHSDFDGDTQSDVLAVHSSGLLISVLVKDSVFQEFGFLTQADPVAGWTVNATGDFNGDKKADLLLYNTTTGEYRTVLLDGATVLSDTVVFTIDPVIGVEPRGVGDFDGDGEVEIIVYHPPSGFTGLVYLTGGIFSSFEEATVIDVAGNWTLENTGHFNSDNKTDLLITNTVTGESAVIEMDGSTATGPTSIFTFAPATGWSVKDTGDFNGDGKTDVLILHSTGALGVLVMDGLVFQSFYVPGGLLSQWDLVNVGNYDVSNKADFLIFDTSTGDLMTAVQDGTTITAYTPVLNLGLGSGWSYHSGKP